MYASIPALVFAVVLNLQLQLLPLGSLDTSRRPLIGIDQVNVDLGTLGSLAKAEHTYTIYNFGAAPLAITGIEVSCGCTAGEVKLKVIPPMDSTKLVVHFDASKKGLGKVQNFISVQSNSWVSPDTVLSFTALVVLDSSIRAKYPDR